MSRIHSPAGVSARILIEQDEADKYFQYRDDVFASIKHAWDVIGPRMNRINVISFVDTPLDEWTQRSLRDLETLRLIEVARPPSEYSNAEIFAGLTDLGNTYYDAMFLAKAETTVPASDRIVRLNHNSPQYRKMTTAVDDVITNVAGDNEYATQRVQEREQVLIALRAARCLLDSEEVRISVVNAMVVPILRFVAENAARGIITTAAATALALVLKYFGLV